MSVAAPARTMTHAEYCAFEREATVKHEYVAGDVFSMTGGTLEHGRLAVQVGHLLTSALDGSSCCVLSSDVRVRIDAVDVDTYPDLSVVCGEPQTSADDPNALINPILIVEVLSESTEGYDRGLKASYYREIPSLQAYLLVAQDRQRLELQVRQSDGRWVLSEAGPGERLTIDPLSIEVEVDAVYRGAISA